MKERKPTPEETRLWRESNRFTTVKASAAPEAVAIEDSDEEALEHALSSSLPLTSSLSRKESEGSAPVAPSRPLAALPIREAKRVFARYGVEGVLDLHGESKLAAYSRVHGYLLEQHRRGARHVLIITGKGRGEAGGVLRQALPHWLNEPAVRPLISAFATARPEKGGAGVTHVLLKGR